MPKALIIPFEKKYEKYTIDYWHKGQMWEFEIFATSIKDAESRLESLIETAQIVGKSNAT